VVVQKAGEKSDLGMGGEWTEDRFGSLVRFVSDKSQAKDAIIDTYVSTENMVVDFGGITPASALPLTGSVTKFKVGDTLFSNIRTYFKKVWQARFDGCCSNDVLVLRPANEGALAPDYLHQICRWEKFTELSIRTSKGAKMPRGDKDALADFKFRLPLIEEQRAIAHILGTLDDKIELNRKQNETLEAMARTLFKAWFVDFEPVRAKLENRWQRGQSLPGLPAHLYDHFPERLVESELGEIPEGWRCGALSDLATYLNGYAFKTKDWAASGHPVVKIGNVKPGFIEVSGASHVSPDIVVGLGRFKLSRGDLLIGMTGYVGETGLVPSIEPPAYLNQRVGKISTKFGVADLGFVYCLVRNPDYKNYAELKSHGSAQANVSSSDLMAYPCVLPETTVLDVFNEMLCPMLQDILENHDESRFLAQLRDTLLPKLISGELRVPDAERIVGAAV